MSTKPVLLFISPRFLFPVDSGGKIRTTQILRGMKGGQFHIKLLSPGTPALAKQFESELGTLCDDFDYWSMSSSGKYKQFARAWHALSRLPIPIREDLSTRAKRKVATALGGRPAVVVFDFLHAAVLAPQKLDCPSVLFTHNVEAEIFQRHEATTTNPFMKMLWRNQTRKMFAYERQAMGQFDVVVAVSNRDAEKFQRDYDHSGAAVIPTGVDTEYFLHRGSAASHQLVFCGSMDWLANQDAIKYFMDDIWALIIRDVPDASMKVIGRAPPANLVNEAQRRGLNWQFTGFVDDVRAHAKDAAISVIPLRIGGGTRLKVYESMAMGAAIVSTSIGVEGLPVVDGVNCRIADDAASFAAATVALLKDHAQCQAISASARHYVEEHCGYRVASKVFESACLSASQRRTQ
jgi:polysaccharide biosynthesis protein PslH